MSALVWTGELTRTHACMCMNIKVMSAESYKAHGRRLRQESVQMKPWTSLWHEMFRVLNPVCLQAAVVFVFPMFSIRLFPRPECCALCPAAPLSIVVKKQQHDLTIYSNSIFTTNHLIELNVCTYLFFFSGSKIYPSISQKSKYFRFLLSYQHIITATFCLMFPLDRGTVISHLHLYSVLWSGSRTTGNCFNLTSCSLVISCMKFDAVS